jgi:uncharacterized protein YjbI with pentapeptide repeats
LSYQVSAKKQILLGVIFLGVILVVLEIGANVWWYGLNTCPYEENEMYSHLDEGDIKQLCDVNLNLTFMDDRVSGGESGDSININTEGFRGAEFSPTKPSDTYRIVMVGGSTTFGSGVFDDETIPFQLEQKFQNEHNEFNVEVINAGIGGSWSKLETDLIKNKIIDYDPNLLIVYDGANDALVEIGEILNHDPEANSESWKNRWIEICDIGNDTSYKTLFVLQPILGTGEKMFTDQEYTIHTNYFALLEQMNYLDSYASQLDEINKHCTVTADFRNIFDDIQQPIYYDIVHLGPKGNEIVANNIYDLVIPLIDISEISDSDLILLKSSTEKTTDEKNSNDSPFSYKTIQVISYLLGYQNRFSDTSQIDLDLSFKGKKFVGTDFSNKDLTQSIFYFSHLTDSSFENTNLKNSDFSYSTLKNISFKNSNLEGVSFRSAGIDNVNFTGANIENNSFSGINMRHTNLTNMDFKDQRFVNSFIYKNDLTNTTFENIDFTGSTIGENIFTGASFRNSDFSESVIADHNLSTVDFTGSTFFKTSFYNNSFNGTDFSNMDIKRAKFALTVLENINFKNTDLTGIDLTGKIYGGIELPGAMIIKSDLSHTDMSKILFYTATEIESVTNLNIDMLRFHVPTIINSNLVNVNLSNVMMPFVKIYDSDLSNADLSDTNLTGAELKNIDLSGANLNGANLMNAIIVDVKLDGTMLNCVNHSICN